MDRSGQQCLYQNSARRMFAEAIIAGHSTDSVIAPALWTVCSPLQLSSVSSLLLSHSPSIPEPLDES